MFVTVAAIFVRILLPIGIVSIVMFAVGANIFLHHRFDGKVMVAKDSSIMMRLVRARQSDTAVPSFRKGKRQPWTLTT